MSEIETTVSSKINGKKRRSSADPKTSVALKRLWHQHIADTGHKVPLKVFVRSLAKDHPLVAEWRGHKHGSLERVAKAARLKNKGARIAAEKQASKAARKK